MSPLTISARLELEVTALRALAQNSLAGLARSEAIHLLDGYRWLDLEHALVYDTLKEMERGAAPAVPAELAQRLTRKGFPDVDLKVLFAPGGRSGGDALDEIRGLAASDPVQGARTPAAG
jgi:hypothetical protein